MNQTQLDNAHGIIELGIGERLLKISKNFKVYEFKCKDGSEKLLVDLDFVREVLQPIRDYSGQSVQINSAYRTKSHNTKVGGSKTSYHMKGMAFDIRTSGLSLTQIAIKAEQLGASGIIMYPHMGFVHLDCRPKKFYAIKDRNGRYNRVNSFTGCPYYEPTTSLYRGKKFMRADNVRWLQWYLREAGFYKSTIDGKFGPNTHYALGLFQERYTPNEVDYHCGPNTIKELKKVHQPKVYTSHEMMGSLNNIHI